MPPETDTIDAPLTETSPDPAAEKEIFGTSLSDIFDKAMPGSKEDIEGEPEPKEEKTEPKVEKSEEPKRDTSGKFLPKEKGKKEPESKPKEEKSEFLPEDIFTDLPKPEKVEAPDEELKPLPVPEHIKSQSARESFKELDTKRIEAVKQLRLERDLRAKAEAKAAEGDPDTKARVADLETQLKNADTLVQRAMLQEHPRFQAQYTIPIQQRLKEAQDTIKEFGGDPNQLVAALNLTGKARDDKMDEILEGVTSKFALGKVERAISEIERLNNERISVLKNSAAVNHKLQQDDQINRSKWFEENERTTKEGLEKARSVLADKFKIGIFKKSSDPKYKDFNDAIDKISTAAEHIMLKTDSKDEMELAANMAAAFPLVWGLFTDKHKQNVELQKRLSEYEDSQPGLGGRTGRKSAKQTEAEDEEDMPIEKAIIRSIRRAQELG